jgi:hypothetical protein
MGAVGMIYSFDDSHDGFLLLRRVIWVSFSALNSGGYRLPVHF